ncbi:hypothetical protein [Rhizobium rhizogenes]|jgi:hypothetical protein|uniref:hypothetical protein n=1 Tax=Rhizobium rhizogenes TaxID=359 RepID=UPI0015746F5D|nr:hypothetical protein [Rhizobium rhizogenes]NTG42709.1 hypothetical protein [Rhizobium rhizogenes]NTG47426.1 hypothetical protein [Rhizobium rhizogenes]
MANFVVIGIPGDPQLYLADLSAGTITPLAPPAGSDLATIDKLRNAGATIIRGVNLAITVGSADDAASGRFDDAASGRFDEGPAGGRFDN